MLIFFPHIIPNQLNAYLNINQIEKIIQFYRIEFTQVGVKGLDLLVNYKFVGSKYDNDNIEIPENEFNLNNFKSKVQFSNINCINKSLAFNLLQTNLTDKDKEEVSI